MMIASRLSLPNAGSVVSHQSGRNAVCDGAPATGGPSAVGNNIKPGARATTSSAIPASGAATGTAAATFLGLGSRSWSPSLPLDGEQRPKPDALRQFVAEFHRAAFVTALGPLILH